VTEKTPATEVDWDGFVEGPTCSICDGLGHGYPGGGPCPIEDDPHYDDRGDHMEFHPQGSDGECARCGTFIAQIYVPVGPNELCERCCS
jgi:hypothetical protein